MARRTRELHPDEVFTTRGGREIPVVSEEQFLNELLSLGRLQMFAGGVISSVVFRQPTDLPGEMVTVGAVLEWKDRTDARDQPEPVSQHDRDIVAAVREGVEIRVEAGSLSREDEQAALDLGTYEPLDVEGEPTVLPEPVTDDGVGDGLEVDPEAVDEDSIPEHQRA
jgi:hypothetical protein